MILRTKKGALVTRHNPVGKKVGSQVHVHRHYAHLVIPPDLLEQALDFGADLDFEFRCLVYDLETGRIRLDEALHFNSGREPVTGNFAWVGGPSGWSGLIWHHKWMWVLDDYRGFDVAESITWSETWLAKIGVPAYGAPGAWLAQLFEAGLE